MFACQVVVASVVVVVVVVVGGVGGVVVVAVVAAVVDDCFHFLVLMKPFERNRQRLMSPLCHLQKKKVLSVAIIGKKNDKKSWSFFNTFDKKGSTQSDSMYLDRIQSH